ncbi:DUF7144 family membrane protein [Kitasatospora cheerisanensis]|uniref:Membrane protein n=1 Tax=Kitasatospora cheerisanensis KCTC 2395 TaxID=1348663 RepID=A0A066Z6Z4_9ACTN|nr:membrane protein [Kitasatospora cheerisanensis KCTC 2395]
MSASVGPTAASTGPGGPPARGNRPWVTGTVLFAGVLMLVSGVLELFRGIMAIAEDDVFVTTPRYVFRFDLTSWGWIHLVVGVLLALTGLFVIKGMLWARILGVGFAAVSMIDNFLAVPYFPLWSLVLIALDVFVIWALCAYHREA